MKAKNLLIGIFLVAISTAASTSSLLIIWNLPDSQVIRWITFVISGIGFVALVAFIYSFFKRKMHLHIHNRLKGCWIALTSTHVIVLGAEPMNAKKQVLSKFNSHNLTPVDINWLMEKGLIHFNATMSSNAAMGIIEGGGNGIDHPDPNQQ